MAGSKPAGQSSSSLIKRRMLGKSGALERPISETNKGTEALGDQKSIE